MFELRCRRVYDGPEAGDGARVLVDRLWPRGLRREAAALDAWEKGVAPSTELRRWFGHDPSRFEEFSARYRAELDASEAAAEFSERCRALLARGPVTLLYAARDERCNHALVLAGWLRERLVA